MNKDELIAAVREETGFTRANVESVLLSTMDTIAKELQRGNEIRIKGFGSFHMKYRAGRTGQNMKSGGTVNIPAVFVPVFEAGKYLKEKTVRVAE